MWASRYWSNYYWAAVYWNKVGGVTPPSTDIGGETVYDGRHNKTLFLRTMRPTVHDNRDNVTVMDDGHHKTIFVRTRRRTIYDKQ